MSDNYPVRLGDLIEYVDKQPGGPLEHLSTASDMGGHLGEVADHLIGHFVDQARKAGASWSEIGENMGVSKQAVQKRFVPREDDSPPTGGGRGFFDRFTKRARRVTVTAASQARAFGHGQIGGEHVLLGLIADPEGIAAKALTAQGVDAVGIREAVLAAHPANPELTGKLPEHIPFGKDAKKILELGLRESLRQGDDFVGTEHILLGLLRDAKSTGALILAGLGVTRERSEELATREKA